MNSNNTQTIQSPISGTVSYEKSCVSVSIVVENETDRFVTKIQRDCMICDDSMVTCAVCCMPWCIYNICEIGCFTCCSNVQNKCCGRKRVTRRRKDVGCCDAIHEPTITQSGMVVYVKANAGSLVADSYYHVVLPNAPPKQAM